MSALTVSKAPVVARTKLDLLSALQAAKDTSLATMAYQGYAVSILPSDQLDVMTRINQLSSLLPTVTIPWEIVDNTFVTWGVSDLKKLQAAMIVHVAATYSNAQALVAKITAAQTLADLAAIDVTKGWPG